MTEYIWNSARPSVNEIKNHDVMIRDVLAGHERMVNKAPIYCRKPEGMNSAKWKEYLKGAHFTNYALQTVQTWTGAALRKPPQIATDGMSVRFKLDYHELDADHLIQHAVWNVLAFGRAAYFVDPEGYIVSYDPNSEVEVKCERGALVKVVLQEDEERLTLHLDDGLAYASWSDNEGTIRRTLPLVAHGKHLTYLPIVFINATDLSHQRALAPLYEIAKLSIQQYDLALCQAHALYYTGAPQPCVFGITAEDEVPTSLGPSTVWRFISPDASATMLTYSGDGIKDREAAMARIESQMASLGAQIMLSRSNAHIVARSQEMKSRESASDLVQIVRNVSDGLTILLRYYAEMQLKAYDLNKVFVKLSEDLIDMPMQADLVRALIEAKRDGLLSFSTWISIMKAGEILPANLDAEEELDRIQSDPAVVRGYAAESDMLDGGDGYPHSDEKEHDHAIAAQ